MDVKSAFLNGDVTEEIYLEQPEGFIDPKNPGKVYRLHKAIYGLKQAAKVWNFKIHSTLLEMGFKRLNSDFGIYALEKGENKTSSFISNRKNTHMFIVLYVDDINVMGNSLEAIKKVKSSLANKFKMTDAGEIAYFLGIRIRRDRKRRIMWLDQHKYIDDILKTFGLNEAHQRQTHATPFATKCELKKNPNPVEEVDPAFRTHYQSIVGHLQYAALCTRPDLAYCTNKLAQHSINPDKSHLAAAKHMLRYLKGTRNLCLTYGGDEPLTGYSDSSWGDNLDDRHSTAGYIWTLAGGAVCWRSKKQPTVAGSSVEAEYQAASDSARQAKWLRIFHQELHLDIDEPLVIKCDNQGSLALIKNPENHERTKHIDIKYHFAREAQEQGHVKTVWVPSAEQLADIFTKALPRDAHERHTANMGLEEYASKKTTYQGHFLFSPLDQGECWNL